jgi:small GTP-binding protein
MSVAASSPRAAGNSPYQGRVVVIGNSSVGKTSLLNRLIDQRFNEAEPNTIGANYQLYSDEVQGVKMEIQIWDTAGQEKFRSLGPIYFRNSSGAVVVFDVTNRSSFDSLDEWVSMFTDVAGNGALVILIGNKCDSPERSISEQEAAQWALSQGFPLFFTSAKTGSGVAEAFHATAERLLGNRTNTQRPLGVAPESRPGGCAC